MSAAASEGIHGLKNIYLFGYVIRAFLKGNVTTVLRDIVILYLLVFIISRLVKSNVNAM